MVKFNIVENDYSLQDKYEEFKEYYLKPEEITLSDIMTFTMTLIIQHEEVNKMINNIIKVGMNVSIVGKKSKLN